MRVDSVQRGKVVPLLVFTFFLFGLVFLSSLQFSRSNAPQSPVLVEEVEYEEEEIQTDAPAAKVQRPKEREV